MDGVRGANWINSSQNGLSTGLEALRRMFDHTNAMSDTFKVFIRTFELVEHFVDLPRVKPFADAFRQVIDVTNVFVFRNRMRDVCTGRALKDHPSGKGLNWVKFSSKMFLLVTDGCTITSWFSRLGAFSGQLHKKMASVKVFGKQFEFNVLRNVGDSAMVVGASLSLTNLINEGRIKGFTAARKVSMVYEANRIAGTLICRIPSITSRVPAAPFAIFGTVSLLVGSALNVTAFLLQKYRAKPAQIAPKGV